MDPRKIYTLSFLRPYSKQFVQQPASLFSVAPSGVGSLKAKMWTLPNTWLVTAYKSSFDQKTSVWFWFCWRGLMFWLHGSLTWISSLLGLVLMHGLNLAAGAKEFFSQYCLFCPFSTYPSIHPSIHPSIPPSIRLLRQLARCVGRPLTIWVWGQQIPTSPFWTPLLTHISG